MQLEKKVLLEMLLEIQDVACPMPPLQSRTFASSSNNL